MHVAGPRRLLHVVGDDDDRVVLLQLVHELLDLQRRDRVERGARLVHQDHVRLDRDRPGDAEALLLAAGQCGAGLAQLVLDLVPDGGPPQRALDQLVHVAAVAGDPWAERHVVVDRLWERVRLLEDHADAASHLDRVDARRRRGPRRGSGLALDACAVDEVVHAVEAAQQGALAAAGWTDDRGDLVARDLQADVAHRAERAVEAATDSSSKTTSSEAKSSSPCAPPEAGWICSDSSSAWVAIRRIVGASCTSRSSSAGAACLDRHAHSAHHRRSYRFRR